MEAMQSFHWIALDMHHPSKQIKHKPLSSLLPLLIPPRSNEPESPTFFLLQHCTNPFILLHQ